MKKGKRRRKSKDEGEGRRDYIDEGDGLCAVGRSCFVKGK